METSIPTRAASSRKPSPPAPSHLLWDTTWAEPPASPRSTHSGSQKVSQNDQRKSQNPKSGASLSGSGWQHGACLLARLGPGQMAGLPGAESTHFTCLCWDPPPPQTPTQGEEPTRGSGTPTRSPITGSPGPRAGRGSRLLGVRCDHGWSLWAFLPTHPCLGGVWSTSQDTGVHAPSRTFSHHQVWGRQRRGGLFPTAEGPRGWPLEAGEGGWQVAGMLMKTGVRGGGLGADRIR